MKRGGDGHVILTVVESVPDDVIIQNKRTKVKSWVDS